MEFLTSIIRDCIHCQTGVERRYHGLDKEGNYIFQENIINFAKGLKLNHTVVVYKL